MADIPQKLGKYEVRRELGRGAMGIVYEGWDPMIARQVALKTVRREQLDRVEAEEILSRFQREAQAAGRLNHPNVVGVYDFGEDADGTAYIAMEYVEGKELKDYFDRQERFSLEDAVRIMRELLSALDHAHSHGIVHRDIKPANIFILKDGRAKVGDFGIARIESSNLTQAGSVLGTPAYMSPEQFMGQRVDRRSDIFSAGVILYQFLSGEKPFAGQLTTIMHKVLKEEPIAPSELNVQSPTAFDTVVRKAMAKRPEERFQTAREFLDALDQAFARRSASVEATLLGQAPADPDATYVGAASDDATRVHAPAPGSDATVLTPVPSVAAAAVAAAATPVASSTPGAPPPMPPTFGQIVQPEVPPAPGAPPAQPVRRHSPAYPIAAAVGAALVVGAGTIGWLYHSSKTSGNPPAPAAQGAVAPASTTPAAAADTTAPKLMTISAVAWADPSDPRFAADPGALRASLREEARRELVEKAVALYVQPASLAQNYAVLRDKLLARSGDFIETTLQEDAPQTGKDGLVSMNTKATVRVREVQKSLNQMSREERVDFIRNNGDPKISVVISTASATEGAEARRSPIAENVLKEKIQTFGFRTWSEDSGDKKADFAVQGEAKFKKLSVRLQASGLQIDRTAITSWTIKCIDKKTGEEIYYNTTIPQKISWNSEDEALADIGKLVGEEFSKNFFLQNFHFGAQKVRLNIAGLPDDAFGKRLAGEISGLRNVLAVNAPRSDQIDVDLSGGQVNLADLVSATVALPLNRKFGKTCFNVGAVSGNEIGLEFNAACKDPATLARLESAPAAALYDAPEAKRQALIRNPEVLKKLAI